MCVHPYNSHVYGGAQLLRQAGVEAVSGLKWSGQGRYFNQYPATKAMKL
jgi:hypothetical protein